MDDIPRADLDAIVADAFRAFDHPEVAPLVDLGEFKVLELFHGPTLSFKDIALQVLGRLFEYILQGTGGGLNIIGATSGDTGSAAIHGVRGRSGIAIFVLYPNGRVSRLQELQMTTVADANVHCLAINGSFDDCQSMLKAVFGDLAFKERYRLGAVNSMNWARVLAQMSYYVYAGLRCDGPVVFSVPTGNFGNIFAGIAVRAMGLPIERFVLATNDNDILAQFFQTGVYRRGAVRRTISPSMDIQVASNFERFVYLRFGRDAERVRAFMADFARHDEASLDDGMPVDEGIVSAAVDTRQTVATIRDVHAHHGYVADPHTAGRHCRRPPMRHRVAADLHGRGASGEIPGIGERGARWRRHRPTPGPRSVGRRQRPAHGARGGSECPDGLRAKPRGPSLAAASGRDPHAAHPKHRPLRIRQHRSVANDEPRQAGAPPVRPRRAGPRSALRPGAPTAWRWRPAVP